VLRRYGVEVGPLDDTMLLSYVLEGGLHGHGMDELAERHLGHATIKFSEVAGSGRSQVTFDKVPLDKALDYAAEDAEVTLRLHEFLKRRLLEERMVTLYETIERPLVPVLTEMEVTGIKCDRDALRRLSNDFAQRIEELEHPPGANAVAVLPPGPVQHVRLRPAWGKLAAEPLAEGEVLEVEADVDGEAPAVRPCEVRSRRDRGVGVAAVARERHLGKAPAPGLMRSGLRPSINAPLRLLRHRGRGVALGPPAGG